MIAANDHAAAGRIADDNFARPAALIKEWRFAITHCHWRKVTMKPRKNTKKLRFAFMRFVPAGDEVTSL
jgi:hypothetical protein